MSHRSQYIDMSVSRPPPPSRVTTGPTLRAVTRRKRPSLSPQKWRSGLTPEQQKQRSQSHSSSASCPPLQKELQGLDLTMQNPKTAALDFEEFSYVDDQGTFRRIGAAWLDILCEYLAKYYQAESLSEILPYLVVWCKDTVPPLSERPFMIAGLVAVWLVQGKDTYPRVRFSSYLPMYTRKPYTNFARRICTLEKWAVVRTSNGYRWSRTCSLILSLSSSRKLKPAYDCKDGGGPEIPQWSNSRARAKAFEGTKSNKVRWPVR